MGCVLFYVLCDPAIVPAWILFEKVSESSVIESLLNFLYASKSILAMLILMFLPVWGFAISYAVVIIPLIYILSAIGLPVVSGTLSSQMALNQCPYFSIAPSSSGVKSSVTIISYGYGAIFIYCFLSSSTVLVMVVVLRLLNVYKAKEYSKRIGSQDQSLISYQWTLTRGGMFECDSI